MKTFKSAAAKSFHFVSMYARSMRDFGKARYLLCKMLGREGALPVLDQEIVDAGWKEFKRIPLKGLKNWIGIYRKTDP